MRYFGRVVPDRQTTASRITNRIATVGRIAFTGSIAITGSMPTMDSMPTANSMATAGSTAIGRQQATGSRASEVVAVARGWLAVVADFLLFKAWHRILRRLGASGSRAFRRFVAGC